MQTFKIKKPIDNWNSGDPNLGLLLTISSYDDNKLIAIYNDTNEGAFATFAVVKAESNGKLLIHALIPTYLFRWTAYIGG